MKNEAAAYVTPIQCFAPYFFFANALIFSAFATRERRNSYPMNIVYRK